LRQRVIQPVRPQRVSIHGAGTIYKETHDMTRREKVMLCIALLVTFALCGLIAVCTHF
jgi:hypothetical protein